MKTNDLIGLVVIAIGIFGWMSSSPNSQSTEPKTEIDSIVMTHAPSGSGHHLALLSACLRASSNSIALDAKGRNLYKTPSDMQSVLLRALEVSYGAGFDFKEEYPKLAEQIQIWIEQNLESVTDRATLVSKLRELADAYEASSVYNSRLW